MNTRSFILRLGFIFSVLVIAVITVISTLLYREADRSVRDVTALYIESTFEKYQDEITGNLMINDTDLIKSLLQDISKTKDVQIELSINPESILLIGQKDGSHKSTDLENLSRSVLRFDYSHNSHSSSETISKVFNLGIGNNNFGTIKISKRLNYSVSERVKQIATFSLFTLMVMFSGFLILYRFLNNRLLKPIYNLCLRVAENPRSFNSSSLNLNHKVVTEVQTLCRTIEEMSQEIQDQAKVEAFASVARQVAHDIRSPLSALYMVDAQLSVLNEETRVIVRSAIARIRDIANDILIRNKEFIRKNKTNREKARAVADANIQTTAASQQAKIDNNEICLMPSLLESLVTEKRLQYRSLIDISIDFRIEPSAYGLFCKLNPSEIKRVISNIVNNSVEAIESAGSVTISLSGDHKSVFINIKDNGKRIPEYLLSSLGNVKGKTHNKVGGNRLGLFYSKDTIEKAGGTFALTSKEEEEEEEGTCITLALPKVTPPTWFVSELKFDSSTSIIILDDDISIHQVWDQRLINLNIPKENILHFSTPIEFDLHYSEGGTQNKSIFLFDYELIGFKETGLDIMKKHKLDPSTSILITSHYEDFKLQSECKMLGVKLIPKSLASLVPINLI